MVVRKRGRPAGAKNRLKRKTLDVKVSPVVAREIWAILYLSVGILTILSIKGAFGVVGNVWVDLLKPVLGWGIFIIPAVFILISILLFFSKEVKFGAAKTFGLFFFVLSVLSIFHLSVPIDQLHSYASAGTYGGYVGFVTNFLLLDILGIGRVGATIIFVAMFLVSMLLIFEVSLKEILSFIIPQVRIQVEREKNGKKKHIEEDLDEVEDEVEEEYEDEQPEIYIHKSKVTEKPDGVIYENEDEKLNINKAAQEKNNMNIAISGTEETEDDYMWEFPSLDLLDPGESTVQIDESVLMEKAEKIKKKLFQFGINVVMHEVNVGPTVIQYTLKPHEGVKLSKITSLKNDLALALAAERIRVEAPIPGKSLVGIEVPNMQRAVVRMRELLESEPFTDAKSKLTLPLGRDVAGKPIVANLENMPHLLIAGATGSGKSICMNSFLMALLYQNSPRDLNFIMIDPKRVELTTYNSIPHLLTPVIEETEKAAIALRWVVSEMTRRYTDLSRHRVRNITEFNELPDVKKLSRIVVVVDELADLMMASGKEVEASICRIAQMARAVGIHLIIATQRPSVDVITGLIKANIPARISFAVSSSIDSRTILDGVGAEDLLGKGDMLYLPTGMNKPMRVQGIYVSTKEIERVTNRIKLTVEPTYDETITSLDTARQKVSGVPDSVVNSEDDDTLFEAAFNLVKETRKASASLFQRRLKVGYARAARLIDLLEEKGVVGPSNGAKPRDVLISRE